MRITRKGMASAIEGALLGQKKFVYKSKDVIYTASLLKGKCGVQVLWMPRYRKA